MGYSFGNVPYSGPSAASCPDRAEPACLSAGATLSDEAQVAAFELPAMEWDEESGNRLSLLAVAHAPDDPPIGTLPAAAPYNFKDPAVATAWDNNVTLWTADYPDLPWWCR